MKRKIDPYKTLGVGKSATREQIKSAYRKKAKKVHPDAGGSSDQFAELSKAYSLLSDDSKRANYDNTGETEASSDDFIRDRAFSLVGSLFISFVEAFKGNWKNKEVKSELLGKINLGRIDASEKMRLGEEAADFWKSVQKDVVIKSNNLDPIGVFIQDKIRLANIQIKEAEVNLQICKKAEEITKNYNFKKPISSKSITYGRYSVATDKDYFYGLGDRL